MLKPTRRNSKTLGGRTNKFSLLRRCWCYSIWHPPPFFFENKDKASFKYNMDSDEENDNERVISLTHLLFGNIDDDGQLENDFLDPESIRHLHQLRQLGIGTQLKEITDDVDSPSFDFNQSKEDYNGNEDCGIKSPSAVDYSDINELADETEQAVSSNNLNLTFDSKDQEECNTNKESTGDLKPSDKDLMPPPPLPPPKDAFQSSYGPDAEVQITNQSNKDAENDRRTENIEKKLDTPLNAMLPSKYKYMDVTKLFQEFRHGQVLRFSRLFDPGKVSSLPQIWRGVKKKKKRKSFTQPEEREFALKFSQKGLTLNIPPCSPLPEECESDDESKLIKPEERNRSGKTKNESYKLNEFHQGLQLGVLAQLCYGMIC